MVGRGDLDVHDGLEHDRPRLAQRRHEGLAACGGEGDVLAVHAVVLAVIHGHANVHHRVAGNGAAGQHLAHALFHGRDVLARDGAALDRVEKFEATATRQRFHAQEDFAKLPGAAALFLVPVVALGIRRDGFAVGDARRSGVDLELVYIPQPVQQHAQVQLAQAVDDGLVRAGHVLHFQARVFVDQLGEDFPHALLVTMALGFDRQAVDWFRKIERQQMDVFVFSAVVQHGVEVDLVDLGHRHDVTRHGALHLHMLLALQHEQVRHLEGFAAVAHVQQAALRHGALVHAHHAQAAHKRVDGDLEHVGQHVARGVGVGVHRQRVGPLAIQEVGRVGLERVWQQLDDDVEQFGHAGAALG